jgi:hypothetical protein
MTPIDRNEDGAASDDLLEVIESQRQRLAFYADVLLSLGFDPYELMDAVA